MHSNGAVLVTGGAGFIGSHLVELLLDNGYRVRVLDNLSTGRRENLPLSRPALELVVGDIRDLGLVRSCLEGVGAIVHLAAVASVQASIDDPIATHQTNFDGTLNLLEAARAAKIGRFVYASSAAVYGDTALLPVSEETPTRPLSPYAADKLAGEHYLLHYVRKHGLSAVAFRFFNVYGPRQDPTSPYSGVISIFMDRLRSGNGVTIFGDGRQTRDFVYVGDLVEALRMALVRTDVSGEAVNLGTGRECSLLELLAVMERLAGRTIPIQHAAPRVGDIGRSCASIERVRRLFGWSAKTDLAQGLGALLRSQGIESSPP